MKTSTKREIKYYVLELEKAKKNTQTLLDEPNASIDMHGLSYWAKRVEILREEILTQL